MYMELCMTMYVRGLSRENHGNLLCVPTRQYSPPRRFRKRTQSELSWSDLNAFVNEHSLGISPAKLRTMFEKARTKRRDWRAEGRSMPRKVSSDQGVKVGIVLHVVRKTAGVEAYCSSRFTRNGRRVCLSASKLFEHEEITQHLSQAKLPHSWGRNPVLRDAHA